MAVADEPTLADWVWIQDAILQAMVGVLTPAVQAVGLSRSGGEWVVTFFVVNRPSSDFHQDLVEVSGDAESLVGGNIAGTSSAFHSPIRSVIVETTSKSIQGFKDQVDRLLFAQTPV